MALHWAHQVAPRFPDGQLYVNLRGFDPTGSPMSVAEAIRGFLDAFHTPVAQLPANLGAQAALYRSLLADRRVLIVLDNARDAEHVRPLLPGTPSCLVVVTSRSQLTGLVVAEGARPLTLGLLTVAEAHEMLARHLGPERLNGQLVAAEELIAHCARLPLALAIVAARAAEQPTFPLATFVAEVADARSRLDALDTGDHTTQIRAVFSWSYDQLSPPAAQLFRLLGVHPGPDISLVAAASLLGVQRGQIRPLLAELARAHLVSEHAPGRYTFHDLLRAYAIEQAHAHDSEADRRAAMQRMLDHYLHTANAASRLLNPGQDQITLPQALPGVAAERFDRPDQAMAWCSAERSVLVAMIRQAREAEFHIHTLQLAWSLAFFLEYQGHWHDWAEAQQAAVEAAGHTPDRNNLALAHRGLGHAYIRLQRHEEARSHYLRALELYGEAGNDTGQAHTHRGLARLLQQLGRHTDALPHAELALGLYLSAGHRVGQANALNGVGWIHAALGNYEDALILCRRALAMHRAWGNRLGEAATLDSLALAHLRLGRHAHARRLYERAIKLHREFGNRFLEADTLIHLAELCDAAGDVDAANVAWLEALEILDMIGHPRAEEVRVKLVSLDRRTARRR